MIICLTSKCVLRIALSLLTGVLFINSAQALSAKECFGHATSFYEEVFCELKAENVGTTLPDFWQFTKNSPQMQALMLKRPARKIGITIKPVKPKPSPSSVPAINDSQTNSVFSGCAYQNGVVNCGKSQFHYVQNRLNSALGTGALDDNNQLKLQPNPKGHAGGNELITFLNSNYIRYLKKMDEIGLGAETFSYAKFVYFYQAHQEQGVDSAQRFEKMFSYLKKDKKTITVNTSKKLPEEIDFATCDRFSSYIACSPERANYLFVEKR